MDGAAWAGGKPSHSRRGTSRPPIRMLPMWSLLLLAEICDCPGLTHERAGLHLDFCLFTGQLSHFLPVCGCPPPPDLLAHGPPSAAHSPTYPCTRPRPPWTPMVEADHGWPLSFAPVPRRTIHVETRGLHHCTTGGVTACVTACLCCRSHTCLLCLLMHGNS